MEFADSVGELVKSVGGLFTSVVLDAGGEVFPFTSSVVYGDKGLSLLRVCFMLRPRLGVRPPVTLFLALLLLLPFEAALDRRRTVPSLDMISPRDLRFEETGRERLGVVGRDDDEVSFPVGIGGGAGGHCENKGSGTIGIMQFIVILVMLVMFV